MAAGKEDIAPELLKKVQEDYRKRCENDKELARIEALAESGKANGKDTDAYAVRAGELLAAALHDNVSGDVLPDGKMYFNIANRVLPPVLRDNYELVAGMSTRIQQVLNDNAGLHMKALRPDLNEDRVKGLVNLAASADQYEDKRKELEADVVSFSQRISADGFHKNAEFQYTSGFTPKIRREAESGCCEWCQALEGTYDYADVRDTGNDVWRRHRGCRCIVEYDPGDGRRQNAHAKTWSQADDHRKKIEDAERMMEEREREQEREVNADNNKSHIYGVPESWNRIKSDGPIEDALAGTNPYFYNPPQNVKAYDYERNCTNCIPAYEMRCRGYNVSAQPLSENRKLLDEPFNAWVNPDIRSANGIDDIKNYMLTQEDGARIQIVADFDRTPWLDKAGHTFVCTKENGNIVFKDPQLGGIITKREVMEIIEDADIKYARIDNLDITSDGVAACKVE